MPSYNTAHINHQGQNIIIVHVASVFGNKSQQERIQIQTALQQCAVSAGLAGTVVPVWEGPNHVFMSSPPPEWNAFFRKIGWDYFATNQNKVLTCS
jgi:hypothetical protein